MKRKRREVEIFSLYFLDGMCCAFGAVIMLLLITKAAEPRIIEQSKVNERGLIAALQQELYEIRGESEVLDHLALRELGCGNETRRSLQAGPELALIPADAVVRMPLRVHQHGKVMHRGDRRQVAADGDVIRLVVKCAAAGAASEVDRIRRLNDPPDKPRGPRAGHARGRAGPWGGLRRALPRVRGCVGKKGRLEVDA